MNASQSQSGADGDSWLVSSDFQLVWHWRPQLKLETRFTSVGTAEWLRVSSWPQFKEPKRGTICRVQEIINPRSPGGDKGESTFKKQHLSLCCWKISSNSPDLLVWWLWKERIYNRRSYFWRCVKKSGCTIRTVGVQQEGSVFEPRPGFSFMDGLFTDTLAFFYSAKTWLLGLFTFLKCPQVSVCECAGEWLYLWCWWWADHLSRVYPESRPLTLRDGHQTICNLEGIGIMDGRMSWK